MARGRRIIQDSSDDDFPDLQDIVSLKAKGPSKGKASSTAAPTVKAAAVRRRKLGAIADNSLLRPLNDQEAPKVVQTDQVVCKKEGSTTPQRVELRTRNTRPVVKTFDLGDFSEAGSVQEETIVEDFSEDDDESDFEESLYGSSEDEDFEPEVPLQRSSSKSKSSRNGVNGPKVPGERKRSSSPSAQLLSEALEAQQRESSLDKGGREGSARKITYYDKSDASGRSTPTDLAGPLSKLRVHELKPPNSRSSTAIQRRATTPSPPPVPKSRKGLVSPSKKLAHIPATPHHPQTDTFWNQEFIDEWNDEHSPKKQLFPSLITSDNPTKKRATSPTKKSNEPSQAALHKAAKKAFAQSKHELAEKFLQDLDKRITEGKISGMSQSTGGIRIEWTNKLNTTAGRANWKRETIKQKSSTGEIISIQYKHHASIELAEKVIDDEHRLLNVIAHEFCHLANFMISGVTTNPHGREFKAWAAKVTRAFGTDRGIEVTTKHSYDIDFKYVWECTECRLEFKRHSKSINPERHRCGVCKSQLQQTKPIPRAGGAKESEYQRFMKEQMRIIKEENPGSPQKDIMKMVAIRWSQREKGKGYSDKKLSSAPGKEKMESVSKALKELTIVDLT